MKPTGLAGTDGPLGSVFAESDDVKFSRFKKNCCQALVGRFV